MVNGITQRHTDRAGHQPHQRKFQRVGTRHGGLRQSQHAQHGAVVQMPLGKTARRNSHRHRAQQRRQQGHQVQKLLGPGQGLLHLGAPALQRLQPQPAHAGFLNLDLGPLHKLLDCRVRPGHGQPVAQAAGRLHQAGGGQIGGVDHDARRKAHEARAPVGLHHNHLRQRERRIAQQQRLAHLQVQRHQQGRVHPSGAGGWNVAGGHVGRLRRGGHAQRAAQRIAIAHRLQSHQPGRAPGFVGRAAHGGKAQGLGGLQAQRLRLLRHGSGGPVVAVDDGVATQERAGVARQTVLQPVGKKAHRRQSRHRQRDRQHQQPQLARAPIAPQRAPTQLNE